jgi:hypothetical protein
MQAIKARILSNLSFSVLVCLLVIYVIVRALCMDMTHDEAYSFYNVKHFWYVEALCTGNTHWFNFAAIKVAVLLGCEKAWQLRWFTLLSATVFLSVGYQWIKTIKSTPAKVFAFSFLFLNPYLLDYLSLARGYAAGLMFESLGLCFLMMAYAGERPWHSFFALFFSGMAAIANFNFFYFFAAFSLFYFYQYYFKNGFLFLKEKRFYRDLIFSIGVTALVLRALLFITKCSNDIGAYGGENLVESVFYGFVDGLVHRNMSWPPHVIFIIACVLFAIVLCTALFGLYRLKRKHQQLYAYTSVIFLLMLLLLLINKYFFNVLYPTYRTTLMFFPLMAIILTCFFTETLKQATLKKILLYSLSLLFLANFVMSLNLRSTFDYPEQRDAKKAFSLLQELGAKKVGIAPELYGVFRNYYQQTDKYKYSFVGESINTSVPKGIDTETNKLAEYEYLVLFPPYKLSFYKRNKVRFEGLCYFQQTGTLILKVKSGDF